jgi:hypothetical protein
MKKIGLFLIVFVLFCVSCEKDNVLLQETRINDSKENTAKINYRVSIDEAINEVNSLLDAIDNNTGNGNAVTITAGKGRIIKDVQVATKPNKELTLMNAMAGSNENSENVDTLFYVINFENNQGFAIASADQRYEPVFCVTESGNYHYGDSIENPGFEIFMEGLDLYAASICTDPDCLSWIGDIAGPWETVTQVAEKLTVRWGQDSPYSNNCPPYSIIDPYTGAVIGSGRCPSGCVATAIAQIFSYYEYPASHGSYVYNWTNIKQHQSYPAYIN